MIILDSVFIFVLLGFELVIALLHGFSFKIYLGFLLDDHFNNIDLTLNHWVAY